MLQQAEHTPTGSQPLRKHAWDSNDHTFTDKPQQQAIILQSYAHILRSKHVMQGSMMTKGLEGGAGNTSGHDFASITVCWDARQVYILLHRHYLQCCLVGAVCHGWSCVNLREQTWCTHCDIVVKACREEGHDGFLYQHGCFSFPVVWPAFRLGPSPRHPADP